MSNLEDLTGKAVEEGPLRAKAKGRRLRKGRKSYNERTKSEPSLESKSELEEQLRQRMKNQKIKIHFSKAKADERKKCQKGSGGESEHEYDDKVSLHEYGDTELAGNLNHIIQTNKESQDDDSYLA